MRIRIPQSLLSRYCQEPQPSAGHLRARQSVYEAAHTDTICNGLMPKLRPEPRIAGKIHQSIRILEARIRKINSQNHRADKLHFIQRFLRNMLAWGARETSCCDPRRTGPSTSWFD